MGAKFWFWLRDTLQLSYTTYRRSLGWLTLWLVGGIVGGVVAIIIGNIGVADINYRLVDPNLLNMTALTPGLGNFLWQRWVTILVPVLLVFGGGLLGRVTSAVIYPLVFMHGYWLCMSFWWAFLFYSLNAILLLIFYAFWLAIVTAVMFCGMLWALQMARQLRQGCPRENAVWRQLLWGGLVLTGVSLLLGFGEYLVFTCCLGRIVYKPR